MGKIKIPYYRVKNGNGFWEPTREMKDAGMTALACGPDGPAAWALARERNQEWAKIRTTANSAPGRAAPRGSLDEAFRRYRQTAEWAKKAPRTQEEWDRAWKRIDPVFGPLAPSAVTLEAISAFHAGVSRKVSVREAQRCIKIWRALWRVAAALGYCERDADPSLGVRNTEPGRRQAVWSHLEVWRFVKGAWRAGYPGLAAIAAVAWDSSLSPVDARSLTPGQRTAPDVFEVSRAKTGRAALATLSRPAVRVLDAYLAALPATVAPGAPIFRNRSGQPYSKDTLGDDFRAVRAIVFGELERRTLADFRRSGSVEALRGGAEAEGLGAKLANDYATSAHLQRTYTPVDLATVRKVDQARKRGRE